MVLVLYKLVPHPSKYRYLNDSGSFLSNPFPMICGLKSHLQAHGRGLGVTDDSPSNCGEGGDAH